MTTDEPQPGDAPQPGDPSPPGDAPQPGDPRSTGPRPHPRASDVVWAGFAGVLLVLTAVQFVLLAVTLLRAEATFSGGVLVLGFIVTIAWLMMVAWFVLGAWRRSVWGCPFDHVATAPELRRCQRHGTVHASADGPG